MADQALHDWAPRLGRALLALLAGAVAAGATVGLAIVAFDVNPLGPVLVVLAGLVGGGLLLRAGREALLRGLGYGLIAGGLLAVLLWPFFDVGPTG